MLQVDPIQHAGDRRTLPAPGYAGQQNHSLIEFAEFLHDGGQEQAIEIRDRPFDFSRDHPGVAQLHEQIHAEPPGFALVCHHVGEIAPPGVLVNLFVPEPLIIGSHSSHIRLLGDGLHLQLAQKRAADAQDGGFSDLHVKVGASVL